MNYCTLDQLGGSQNITGYIPKMTDTLQRARALEVIARISAQIDDYVSDNRQKDIFDPSPDAPTTKKIWGQGYSYLKLPQFVAGSLTKIELNGTELLPINYEVEDTKVILVDAYGTKHRDYLWTKNRPYTITARWGYEEIPLPIIGACINWAVDEIRFSDGNFQGVIGGTQSNQQPAASFAGAGYKRVRPPSVTAVLDGYKSIYNRQFNLIA